MFFKIGVIKILLFAATSFVVGLSGAMVPGPMLTVTISDSLKKGFLTGPLVVLGHFIGELTIILIIFAGLGWFIGSSTAVFLIGTLGGFVMVIMGYRILSTSDSLKDMEADKVNSKGYGSVLNGVLTSILNPFFFIWWITVGWAFMFKGLELAGILGVLGFLLGHWASDISWFSTVSFFSSRGSQMMTENQFKIIMNISGIFLMILGIYFLLNATRLI